MIHPIQKKFIDFSQTVTQTLRSNPIVAAVAAIALTIFLAGAGFYLFRKREISANPIPTLPPSTSSPVPLTYVPPTEPLPIAPVWNHMATTELKLTQEACEKFTLDAIPGLEALVDQVDSRLNEEQTLKLHQRLRETVGEERASSLMQNWRTTFDFDGEFLSDNDIEVITQQVQEDQRTEEALQADLQAGRAAFHINTIKKATSKIHLQERLKNILKKEYVLQQIRGKNKFTLSSAVEKLVLAELDYDTLRYRNKALVQQLVETALTEHYESLVRDSQTLRDLKQNIQRIAQSSRLQAARVPENHIPRVQTVIAKSAEIQRRVYALFQDLISDSTYTDGITHELNLEVITHSTVHGRQLLAKTALQNLLKEQSETIRTNVNTLPEEAWNTWSEGYGESLLSFSPDQSMIDKAMSKAVSGNAFFRKWNQNLIVNTVQGWNDPNTALGDGVCFANSLRLINNEQNNPNAETVNLASCEITPSDRFNQARYAKAVDLWIKNHRLNPTISPDKTFVINETFRRIDPARKVNILFSTQDPGGAVRPQIRTTMRAFQRRINANEETLRQSHGLLFLTLTGAKHAIYARVDKERNIYRIYDPNLGRLQFKSADEMYNFMNEFFSYMYADITGIDAFQLVPKETAAPVPTCSSS